jgi:DegV family protein with EDD domain
MKIALVTDSTADIPQRLVDQYDIHVVPNVLILDGVSVEDGKGISRKEFYEQLPSMQTFPTTSTASLGTYQSIYENIFKSGVDTILSIHISEHLSGIINTARVAAKTFGGRIRVVDSGQLSLGLGFQVLAAAEAIASGFSLDEVIREIDKVRQRVVVFAMLNTLEYLARSGRVSWAKARIGNLLRIKPFVQVINGKVIRLGDARTRKKGINRLITIIKEQGPYDRFAMLHSNAIPDANRIITELNSDLPADPLIVTVTTIIGAHVGPNGLGFAAVVKTR